MTTSRTFAGVAPGRASEGTSRGASSHPVGAPLPDRADSRPVPLRLGERRERGLGEKILAIAVVAVAGPLIVAVAGTVLLLALVLAGPFLLSAILLVAFALPVLGATGAAG